MATFVTLCCLILLIPLSRSQCFQGGGPVELVPGNSGECQDTGSNEVSVKWTAVRSPNNCNDLTLCAHLTVRLKFGLNNSFETEEHVYCKDSTGRWKPMGEKPERVNACEKDHLWLHKVQSHTGASQLCPIPKGNYTFKMECNYSDFRTKLDYMNLNGVPIYTYGEYKSAITYYRNGLLVGCYYNKYSAVPARN